MANCSVPKTEWLITAAVLSLIIIFSGVYSICGAETGIVKGVVTDKTSKAPLPGITITVEGANIMEFTNDNGEYKISLPPGTYKMRAELLGYNPAEALGVIVIEGETNEVNFVLKEAGVVEGEEIVVTGERLNVALSKTTASVAVVGSKELEKLTTSTNAADLLTNTPGVQVEGGAEFSKIIKIRGRTIAPPSTASAGILLLIDGIPANDPQQGYANMYQIPAENIERIEVLKGASSAQYGGQASAGVINIITRKGQKKPFTKADVQIGTYQRRSGAERELYESYSFVHSWGNKYFDYSINGSYSHLSGTTSAEKAPVANAYRLYAANNPGGVRKPDGTKVFQDRKEIPFMTGANLNELMDVGDRDRGEIYTAGMNLGINLFKGNTLRISPSYTDTSFFIGFSPGNIAIQSEDDSFLQFFLNVRNRRESLNISDKWEITPNLTYNFRMGLTQTIGGAVFMSVNDLIDYNKEAEALGKKDVYANPLGDSPFNPIPTVTRDRQVTLANDLSYKMDIFDGNTVTVGQEYQWVKSVGTVSDYISPFVKHNIHSLYFQNLLAIKDFSISVGARWDQATTYIEEFDDEVSPRFGINYSISPGTSLRFSVGRARRFLDFSRQFGLGQNNGRLWGNPAIGPEINWTYELGFRFSTKYISGDIAYFYDDYADLEVPVPLIALGYESPEEYAKKVLGLSTKRLSDLGIYTGNIRAGTFVNGPDAIFQGFDTNFEIRLLEKLDINVSYLFQRSVVGNNNPFDFGAGKAQKQWWRPDGRTSLGPRFQDEMRIAYSPTHIFKVSSGYELPFGLRIDASGRYKSTTDFFSGNYAGGIFRQPEHWIWDLKVAQPIFNNKIKLTFTIDNVFSKLYYEQGGIPSNVAKYTVGVQAEF